MTAELEQIQLGAFGRCRCGHTLRRDASAFEAEVSLTNLSEAALRFADRARCLCGARRERSGSAWASYRLPGGPWLVAEAALEPRRRRALLSLRSEAPRPGAVARWVLELAPLELELAERAGQPASTRAAWAEAWFALRCGAPEIRFRCGEGLACLLGQDPHSESGCELRELEDRDSWLGPDLCEQLAWGELVALVELDREQARAAAVYELGAGDLRLRVQEGDWKLRLPAGRFTRSTDPDQLIAQAISRGEPVRLRARRERERLERELVALEAAASDVSHRLGALSAVPTGTDATDLLLEIGNRRCVFDLAGYLSASENKRQWMLWEARA